MQRAYDFSELLIVPCQSEFDSRKDVNLICDFEFKNGQKWSGIPIIASNMDSTGTIEIARVLSEYKMLTCLHKFHSIEDYKTIERLGISEYVIPSYGIEGDIISADYSKWICLDVANGYTTKFHSRVQKIRRDFPDHILMAGNVATKLGTKILLDLGVDVIKAGIGSGAQCLTRSVTGVGVPQAFMISEINNDAYLDDSDRSELDNLCLVSDGGCSSSGDVAKAFCLGSDFVMLGSMFAGCDQSGGQVLEIDGKKFKRSYGMSSEEANDKYFDGLSDYKASEGRSVDIPLKGDLNKIVQSLLGGLRSCGSYINSNLNEFYLKSELVLVNNQLNTSLEKHSL